MTTTLPAEWYGSPDIYARERSEVWGREWLLVGRSTQFRRPGDYLAVDIAGWPIVVVAGDGALHGFHNVCRHRGGPLVWDGEGHCAGGLVCRYHGWAYELDGRLRRARDFGADPPVDATALASVAVDTWRGFVFVNLDGVSPPVATVLGEFAARCADFALESFTVAREFVDEVAANWKTYADNYLEGYHIPLVHPGLMREVDARRYQVEVGDGWCEHTAPARDGSPTAGRWLWRFPNLALNVYPGGVNVERYWPLGPRRTRVQYTYLFAPGTSEREQDASIKLSLELLEEDRRICEAVQRNLDAGVYQGGPLSPRHEGGVARFQSLVRTAVGSEG